MTVGAGKRRARSALPPGSTIATIVDGLVGPEEYVRRVFANMGKQGEMQVRISLTSAASHPDYLMDEFFGDDEEIAERAHPVVMFTCNGKNHRADADARRHDNSLWSDVGMSWKEVQSLLGRIRGWQGKAK